MVVWNFMIQHIFLLYIIMFNTFRNNKLHTEPCEQQLAIIGSGINSSRHSIGHFGICMKMCAKGIECIPFIALYLPLL